MNPFYEWCIIELRRGEGVGKGAAKQPAKSLQFVVQEHKATHLHYDFRLEIEGVLKSWAIPKGPSMNPGEKRLAVMTDDHLLEYANYEGIIPEGSYGAGPVIIWDHGIYVPEGDPAEQLKKGRLSFVLSGKKIKGGFTLMILQGRGTGKEWLLIKKRDGDANPTWKLESELKPSRLKKLQVKIPPCESA